MLNLNAIYVHNHYRFDGANYSLDAKSGKIIKSFKPKKKLAN